MHHLPVQMPAPRQCRCFAVFGLSEQGRATARVDASFVSRPTHAPSSPVRQPQHSGLSRLMEHSTKTAHRYVSFMNSKNTNHLRESIQCADVGRVRPCSHVWRRCARQACLRELASRSPKRALLDTTVLCLHTVRCVTWNRRETHGSVARFVCRHAVLTRAGVADGLWKNPHHPGYVGKYCACDSLV